MSAQRRKPGRQLGRFEEVLWTVLLWTEGGRGACWATLQNTPPYTLDEHFLSRAQATCPACTVVGVGWGGVDGGRERPPVS